jgi:probable F420-dependent oxidoreductase
MADRKFRFGVVGGLASDLDELAAFVRRVEDGGYETLLSPDTFNIAAPFATLGAVAAMSRTLRVGTFVLDVPLRRPAAIAWEAASIDRLSGGRFELGIGAGRPGAEGEAKLLGVPWESAARRVDRVAAALAEIKGMFATAVAAAPGGQPVVEHGYLRPAQTPHPPVLIAAAGPRLLGLAAREADMVSFALAKDTSDAALADRVRTVREAAGDRFDDLELSVNVQAAGDGPLPSWLTGRFGVDPELARDNGSIAVLTGNPDTIADVLLRRRDRFGISYVTVAAHAVDAFAPVVERLAGR